MEQINLVDSLLVQTQQKDSIENRAKAKKRELNEVRSEKLVSVHWVDTRFRLDWFRLIESTVRSA